MLGISHATLEERLLVASLLGMTSKKEGREEAAQGRASSPRVARLKSARQAVLRPY